MSHKVAGKRKKKARATHIKANVRKAMSSASTSGLKRKAGSANSSCSSKQQCQRTTAACKRSKPGSLPPRKLLAFATASIKRAVYAAASPSSQDGAGSGAITAVAGAGIGRLSKECLTILSSCAEQFVSALAKEVAKSARTARVRKVRVLDVKNATHMDPRFDFLQNLFEASADGTLSSLSLSTAGATEAAGTRMSSRVAASSLSSSSSTEASKRTDDLTLNDSALGAIASESSQLEYPRGCSRGKGVGRGGRRSTLPYVMNVEIDDYESLEHVQHDKVLDYEEAQYEDY